MYLKCFTYTKCLLTAIHLFNIFFKAIYGANAMGGALNFLFGQFYFKLFPFLLDTF